ncbi:hypothetical protein ABIA35_000317 [Catenulispora sp. MAP12-49]|uniref:hypothetical protein n=1 Tax=Catenulispora sp. MAP12-49 TaxID=3156302 RepID=UPI0035182B0C
MIRLGGFLECCEELRHLGVVFDAAELGVAWAMPVPVHNMTILPSRQRVAFLLTRRAMENISGRPLAQRCGDTRWAFSSEAARLCMARSARTASG